eukprot:1158599-Pelagomonas_calceolata.AAC.12
MDLVHLVAGRNKFGAPGMHLVHLVAGRRWHHAVGAPVVAGRRQVSTSQEAACIEESFLNEHLWSPSGSRFGMRDTKC